LTFDLGARRAAFFTIYSDTGDEQIAVSLGDDITLFYEDPDTKLASKKTISFGADISDGTDPTQLSQNLHNSQGQRRSLRMARRCRNM
jgi:hypothetical protein